MKQSLVSFIIAICSAAQAWGAPSDTKPYHAELNQSFSAVAANPSTGQKQGLFNELLSAQSSGLAWPDFPRTWIQKDIQKYVETTTSYVGSLNIPSIVPLVNAGISQKYNIAYKYNTRISFIAVTKMRVKNADVNDNRRLVSDAPAGGEELEAIRYFDSKTNKNYFRTDASSPMVGFCVYEMSLSISKTADHTLSFMTISETASGGDVLSETQAIYSKFFQIDSKTPEMDYLKIKCEKNFQEMVRPYVENDFNKVLIEYVTYNHPASQCLPNGVSNEDGDENCQGWFKKTQDSLNQKITVPRCEQGKDGISRCVLKARKDMSCPLYVGQDGQYTDRWTGHYREATTNTYAHACDQGLKCQMEKNPFRIGSLIVWPGSASCK